GRERRVVPRGQHGQPSVRLIPQKPCLGCLEHPCHFDDDGVEEVGEGRAFLDERDQAAKCLPFFVRPDERGRWWWPHLHLNRRRPPTILLAEFSTDRDAPHVDRWA